MRFELSNGQTSELAISRAKDLKKKEILESPDRGTWDRPYHAIRLKLRTSAPFPLMEILQPSVLLEWSRYFFHSG